MEFVSLSTTTTRTHTHAQRLTKRTLSKHRHASPSAPWPWVDLDDQLDSAQSQRIPTKWECPCGEQCIDCWAKYPQSLFPNWTDAQVKKSGMKDHVPEGETAIYRVDVLDDGHFEDPGKRVIVGREHDVFWKTLQKTKRRRDVRLRVLFVENLSVPVMQMLGTR